MGTKTQVDKTLQGLDEPTTSVEDQPGALELQCIYEATSNKEQASCNSELIEDKKAESCDKGDETARKISAKKKVHERAVLGNIDMGADEVTRHGPTIADKSEKYGFLNDDTSQEKMATKFTIGRETEIDIVDGATPF